MEPFETFRFVVRETMCHAGLCTTSYRGPMIYDGAAVVSRVNQYVPISIQFCGHLTRLCTRKRLSSINVGCYRLYFVRFTPGMMHDTRLPRARRLVDAFFVIFYYMSLTACLSRLGLCLTVLKCTSFAFSVGSCGVTKQFRSSKVPLKQQGRFPAHNASSTLDYFDLERHMVMLSAKYAFRNDMSTRNSFGPERRNKGYNELQFEPEGMTWKAELFIGGADVTVEIDTVRGQNSRY